MSTAKIISGFPGVGKTHYYNDDHSLVMDSDSSKYSWIKPGERNPDFPNNYMIHIKENLNNSEFIFVSTHKDVRAALEQDDLHYTLVYPERSLKEEYLQRFVDRGDADAFVELINKNWDNFLLELEKQTSCDKIVLSAGQYLSDVL